MGLLSTPTKEGGKHGGGWVTPVILIVRNLRQEVGKDGSSRGPEFKSQHPHGGCHLSVTPVPGTHPAPSHQPTCKRNTNAQNQVIEKKMEANK